MSGKQAKKLRQLYRRDLGQQLRKNIQKATEEMEGLLKPAPKWIPDFIWVSLQKLFLNI